MVDLLSRLFVRGYQNPSDPAVRARYGTMVAIVCILANTLLSAAKFLAGLLLGSIAITADAVNNLSDAGSSLIGLISFRISAKPADRDHPFGHARIEYVASMIVSFLILLVGFELFRSSIDKIANPTAPDGEYIVLSVIILTASVLVKLWMALLNRRIGRRIDSSVMRATAADCLFDCISTFAALTSTVLYALLGWNFLDGWFGLGVSLLIFWAGIRVLNDTKNALLGEKPVEETVNGIREIVGEYPEAIGIHDMLVHNYGPGHTVASLHIEVNGAGDIYALHDVIDNIERRLSEELGIQCTIHMDPIVVGDPLIDLLREETTALAAELFEGVRIHDFRFVPGTTHTNLIFDAAVPFECPMTDEELKESLTAAIRKKHPTFFTVITIDRE